MIEKENKPVFSVITVCYQACDVIEETIRSVLGQTNRDFEYIIVDGNSTDGTREVISRYLSDERVRFLSEPDKGLYDAMNKGIRLARGGWLNFMNAGDCYADQEVLRDVAQAINENTGSDFIYGDIIYRYPDGTERIRRYPQYCSTAVYQLLGDCINHQSLFSRKENFINNEFDLSYKVNCYRDWITHQHKLKKKFKSLDRIICKYSLDDNAYTTRNIKKHWQELDIIIRKYYPLGYPFYKLVNLIRNGRVSGKILHRVYEAVFLRNKGA